MRKEKILQLTALLVLVFMLCALSACGGKTAGKIESIPTVQQVQVETPEPVDENAGPYEEAARLQTEGKLEEAAAAFEALGSYRDAADRAEQCRADLQEENYQNALGLEDAGELRSAFALFSAMPGYKDADDRAAELKTLVAMQDELASAEKGTTVTFGSYEQDGNADNGAEPVEWYVLDRQEDRLILLSRYIIDIGPFHSDRVDITWEESTVRAWLNDEFIGAAFNGNEKQLLILTDVEPHANPKYPRDFQDRTITPGNATRDRVWLLSEEEAKALSAAMLKAESTKAAASGGTMGVHAKETVSVVDPVGTWHSYDITSNRTTYIDYSRNWWLRTPGDLQCKAMYVSEAGRLMYEGRYVNMELFGIRPAICVNIG